MPPAARGLRGALLAASAALTLAATPSAGGAAPAAAPPPSSPLKLYVYAEGNLRNASFLDVLLGWTSKAKQCGYDGMFYADSDFQTLHLDGKNHSGAGPPLADSGCEWCKLGSAEGFRKAAGKWQAHAKALDFELFPLVFPFGPSDPILLQPDSGGPHNLVEPLPFKGTRFTVGPAPTLELQLVDEMAGTALQNAGFAPPASGDKFEHWAQDEPGVRTFVDREVKRGAGGASLRIGPGSGDGMAMQPLAVPPLRLAKISFWARTSNFSAVQYNVEVRTLEYACANRSSSTTGSGGSAAANHERCSVWMSKGRRLSWWSLVLNATQEWTRFEYTAPSWSEPVGLFLGIEDRGTPQ